MKPPKRVRGESTKAYEAFLAYLEMGNGRSLAKLAEGPPRRRLKSLKTWSARFDWQERLAAHEAGLVAAAMKGREVALEKLRQRFIDKATRGQDIFFELMEGIPPERAKTYAVMDRNGDEVGQKLTVPASTIKEICRDVFDRAGLTVPKRVELSGPDGKDLLVSAQAAVGVMSEEQIRALLEHFPEVDE